MRSWLQEVNANGPVPTGCEAYADAGNPASFWSRTSAFCSASAFGEDIARAGRVKAWRNPVNGLVRLIRTLSSAPAVQFLKIDKAALSAKFLKTLLNMIPGACWRNVAGKLNQRLKLVHTAAALKEVPSWNVTFWRRVKS